MNITIENKFPMRNVPGTTSWVRKILKRSEVVILDESESYSDRIVLRNRKTGSEQIIAFKSESSNYVHWEYECDKTIKIVAPSSRHCVRALFGYLTPDAERIVYDFIIACAGALSKYINNKKSCNQHNNPQ